MPKVRPLRPHYLPRNEANRTPRNWVFFDSEAHATTTRTGEIQTFMLAQARHVREQTDRANKRVVTDGTFFDPADLWGWITSKVTRSRRLIVVAHNLAYDLRICQAFSILPELGWVADRVKLDPGCASCHWTKDKASIQMVDMYSYLPLPLERIGLDIGVPKLDLPDDYGSEVDWLARCVRDVDILEAAYWRILEFTRNEELGNWQPTGSGQAFAAWRHRFYPDGVLVGTDATNREMEREAAWSGRCEVWQHGTRRNGPYTEWDYELAYGQVATHDHLPLACRGVTRSMTLARVRKLYPKVAVLARVTVTTDKPVVPTKVDGRICWPIGTFDTTLWSQEIILAANEGARISFGEARVYSTGPALKGFMEWALNIAKGNDQGKDPIVRALAKQWTRTLVGRLGMHYHSWEPFGESETNECLLMDGTNLDSGETFRLMWIGKQIYRESEILEFPDGTPAIMSYVMSEMRVHIWEAMAIAGRSNCLYLDTDSLLVNEAGNRQLEQATANGKLDGLRRKASYAHVDLWAPRQICLDSTLKAAGVSKRAIRVTPTEYKAEAWQSLTSALKKGNPNEVVISERRVKLKGIDHRRKHLPNGSTSAWQLPEELAIV